MPISLEEINTKVEAMGSAWEAFKQKNDERLDEIKKRGVDDPLTKEQLDKMSAFMDTTKDSLDKVNAEIKEVAKVAARTHKGSNDPDKDAETPEMREYVKSMRDWLVKGDKAAPNMDVLQQKALQVNYDPDGGYLVTPTMSSTIIKTINEFSPVRSVATVETISSDALELLEDKGVFTSGWVGETGARPATANTQFGKKHIQAQELYAMPIATQKMLDDASMNIETWIAQKAAESFAIKEATAFVSGNGVSQPRGFLTYAAGTSWGQIEQINSGSSGAVTADGIVNLVYGLKEGYTRGASFMMKRATIGAVRLLKESTTNAYIWQPGLQLGQPSALMSYPVFEATDMPAIAANSLSIAFANWKQAYTIVDRKGVTLLRDPFTNKPFVQFYFTKRVGGDVTNFEAIKLQKLA